MKMKASEVRKMSAKELESKLMELKKDRSSFVFSTPPISWTTPSASPR